MKIVLRTRCGCTREVDFGDRSRVPDTVRIPLRGDLKNGQTWMEQRTFKYDGRREDGTPVFIELPDTVH